MPSILVDRRGPILHLTLNRPDVLPVDDLGLREGIRAMGKFEHRPTAAECTARGEIWRPWRSIATWYLWRRDSKPAAVTE